MQLNHRSWADFMIDQYVTEGRSMFVGRWAVLAAFPLAMIPLRAIRCVILFKRGSIKDIEGFNNWIDTQFAASPQTGLAVYPEGHRSTHGESLPLKRGMLKYAYTRKLPVQIVIGGNKEAILSEKHRTARFHQTVAVGFSEVLKPEDYSNFEIFMQKVQSTWDKEWNEVFTANLEGLPVLPEVEEPQFDYPMDISIMMTIFAVLNILIAAWALRLTWRVVAAVMAILGPLQWPVAVIVVAYIVGSFYVYSQHENVLLLHQKMLQQRLQAPAVVAAAGEENHKKGQ
jgi:1-acyl-sn-glycerol-3-phosphate acyltransferase